MERSIADITSEQHIFYYCNMQIKVAFDKRQSEDLCIKGTYLKKKKRQTREIIATIYISPIKDSSVQMNHQQHPTKKTFNL